MLLLWHSSYPVRRRIGPAPVNLEEDETILLLWWAYVRYLQREV